MLHAFEQTKLWLPTTLLTIVVFLIVALILRKRNGYREVAALAGVAAGTVVGTFMMYAASGDPFNAWAVILVPIYATNAAVVSCAAAFVMWFLLRVIAARRRGNDRRRVPSARRN